MRPTTDLYDDFEDISQTCAVQFRDYGGKRNFCGPIRTVTCLNDNVLFRQLLDEPGNGAVIVVDELVEFGGVRFEPGAWVYSDEDGVLVAPNELR